MLQCVAVCCSVLQCVAPFIERDRSGVYVIYDMYYEILVYM